MPVEKQTCVVQWTRINAFIAIRDYNGHVGMDVRCSQEVAIPFMVLTSGYISIILYIKATGRTRSASAIPFLARRPATVALCWYPAPHHPDALSSPRPLCLMANINCYALDRGYTTVLCDFTKAAFDAVSKTYSILMPELWKNMLTTSPYQEFTDHV